MTVFVWKNYPDVSTPLTADNLNEWTEDLTLVSDTAQASADVAAIAAGLAEDAAADAAASAVVNLAPTDTQVAFLTANTASETRTALDATYDARAPRVHHVDLFDGFFRGLAWNTAQPGGDLTTTLTAQATAGATTLSVASGTLAPNGTSLITNPGTASQQVYEVTAGGGTTTLTVSPPVVTTLASGATIATLWSNATHPTISGYNALAYYLAHAEDENGVRVIQDPGTRPIVLFGNSWLYGMRAVAATHLTALYPGATVVDASVSGNSSQNLVDRFATDVPTNAAYVVFNEPGVNDEHLFGASITFQDMQARLEELVRLVRGIGAIPVFLGIPPIQSKPYTPAHAAWIKAQIGNGWGFPGLPTSSLVDIYPTANLPTRYGTPATSVGVGDGALLLNVAGINSTALGYRAAYLTTANEVSSVGSESLMFNTTGTRLAAVGYQTGWSNTTGTDHTFVGNRAGYGVTGSLGVTAVGSKTYTADSSGVLGTAIGYEASMFNTSGTSNVAVGAQAGREVTTGGTNTYVGTQAGYMPGNVATRKSTTGIGQTVIGYQSGQATSTPVNYITTLGRNTMVTAAGGVALGTDSTGNGALSVGANEFVLGTASHRYKMPGLPTTNPGAGTGILWNDAGVVKVA